MKKKLFLFVIFIFVSSQVVCAETDKVQFKVLTEYESIKPGEPFWLILQTKTEKDWYFYYKNPGDSGKPLQINLISPSDFKNDDVLWPKPKRFEKNGLTTFGYDGENCFLVKIHPPKNLKINDNVTLAVHLDGLACGSSCELFNKTISINRKISNNLQINADAKKHLKQLPKQNKKSQTPFLLILFFAFLGGIILNAMPCVFPVISLKILHFVKLAKQDRLSSFKHGLYFTAGVLISFWILGTIVLSLKAFGTSVGWGFQLQNPIFVAIMICLLFILSLNLFGIFEFGESLTSIGILSTKHQNFIGSFTGGILAALVATPCTGPFLGTAIGFTISLHPLLVLVIFTAIAIGMACPYLILSANPLWLSFLPKPGKWMIIFKQLLGFFMMSVVAWLLWVFASQTSNNALFAILISLILIAMGYYIYGKRYTKKALLTIIALIFIVTGCYIAIASAHQKQIFEEKQHWVEFSWDKVDKLRAEGHPVFIDFTAKWCMLCQTNKIALHSKTVMKKFDEMGVQLMVADFTNQDKKILEAIQSFGKNGVPLYVYYPSGKEAIILPEILTINNILKYLDKNYDFTNTSSNTTTQ